MGKPRRRRRREQRDPWTTDARDPLESLARLVGRCAHPTGGGGSGGVPIADADLTSALGYMPDKLGAALAMSVAGRHDRLMPYMTQRAWRRVAKWVAEDRDRPVDLRDPVDRFRARVVLVDALHALVWPEARTSMSAAARTAKMRATDYATLYRLFEARLNEVLNDARREFRIRMWADELQKLARRARAASAPGSVGVLLLRTDVEPWQTEGYRIAGDFAGLVALLQQDGRWVPLLARAAEALVAIGDSCARRRRSAQFEFAGAPFLAIAAPITTGTARA